MSVKEVEIELERIRESFEPIDITPAKEAPKQRKPALEIVKPKSKKNKKKNRDDKD